MNTWAMIAVTLVLLMSATCSTDIPQLPAEVGDKWQLINARERFTFLIPGEMEYEDVKGEDSFVGAYRGENMRVEFDYGRYSAPLQHQDKPEYQSTTVKIDGRNAKLVTFRYPEVPNDLKYIAAVHFDDLGVSSEGGENIKLTMRVYCRSPAEYEVAKKILYSIKFTI